MTLVCAWCDTCLGEKAPLAQTGVTHGMCAPCLSERLGSQDETFQVPPGLSFGFAEAVAPAY